LFSADILPPRDAGHIRQFDETDMLVQYESNREWVDDVDKWDRESAETANVSFRHEQYLDFLFWEASLPTPTVCIVGSVGSGKSTLVDYYLRCYCPKRGRNRSRFNEIIVVKLDCLADPHAADLKLAFFHSAQDDIRIQCKQLNFDIDTVMKRHGPVRNIKEWVWTALKVLSEHAAIPSSPFRYVVIFIDNLDQCPIDVQLSMLSTIQHYIHDTGINVWRLFVPLWPGTLAKLSAEGKNLLRGAKRFMIGEIETYDLLHSRNRSFSSVMRSKADSIPEVAVESNVEGRGTLYLNTESFTDFVQKSLHGYRKGFGDLLDCLSNGNLRRSLAILGEALRGGRSFQVWQWKKKDVSDGRSYMFDTLLSLLTGAHRHLEHDLNRIANVFLLGGTKDSRYALMGYHAIWVLCQLCKEVCPTKERYIDHMKALGYMEKKAQDTYGELFKLSLFHEEPSSVVSHGGERRRVTPLVIHERPAEAYLELATCPEYLSAVAQVTPVDEDAYETMKSIDVAYDNSFLRDAVKCLEFIEFIKRAEGVFARGMPDHKDEDIPVPVVWKRMASNYFDRLTGLRTSGLLSAVTYADWLSLLAHPIFAHVRHH
jgi:hypothetical protein